MSNNMIRMDIQETSSRFGSLRNLSSSSSAFFSANQSPIFSPKLATCPLPTDSHNQHDANSRHLDSLKIDEGSKVDFESFSEPHKLDNVSSSVGINSRGTSCDSHHPNDSRVHRNKAKSIGIARLPETSTPPASSFSSDRLRCCDVYIGFHCRKPLLLRFANWLRAELELQGLSCFLTDKSRCRNSHKHSIVEKAMYACTYGVVILTKKSFKNPYTIDELRFFSSKKNLVPVYFDLSPDDCLVRDIIEKRGELWEMHGGDLWLLYGGQEKEWRDAINSLSRADDWKLEAQDGKWRDCILRAVSLLALRLGRRSIVDRLSKWREKAEKEEFPFPRNESFVGRKKELSELEFMLFGDVCGDAEKDYFEFRTRPRRKRSMTERDQQRENSKKKGKEPVWKESEKEIEMQHSEFSQSKPKHGRRKRSMKVIYGKGIASVSGEAGIGKTELLLEFAYKFQQRYKLVLWVGGESRFIRQNFLNLWSIWEIDIGVESTQSSAEKGRRKSFEEQEEAAITRIRKELMRNIPFLMIIDNVESEKDWWDHKLIMDLLPRFGGETQVLISTRLSRIMNLEPLRLSYISEGEAMSLMQGSMKDLLVTEFDALRAIEEKLGRLTLGLAIVGAILSELPITPSRLLDTINRTPSRDIASTREDHLLRRNSFLLQLFEVCFSIFNHADGPRSLATRMVLASGWFAPSPIPTSILALAAHNIPEKHHNRRLWRKIIYSLTCGFTSSYARRSEAEASSLLLRFCVARSCTKEGFIQFNELVKQYSRKRGMTGVAQATVQAIITRGSISLHPDHIWAACFLLLGFGKDPAVVKLKVQELLFLVKEMILPLAIKTFLTFSRCSAAMELLRLATDILETMDQEFVTPVEKWLDRSICSRPVQNNAQLNPSLWQELTLARANLLEVRAKLMARGGQFDIGDDLIRRAIFIRSSIYGEDHPDTISAKETLSKLNRLSASVQRHNSP